MRRFLGPICLIALAVLVGVFALRDHSVHVSFPLSTDGRTVTSPAFKGDGGLYLITLEMDPIEDRHHTSCLLGGDLLPYPAPSPSFGTSGCDVAPAISVSWELYGDGKVAASDRPGSMLGVEPMARYAPDKRRVEREIGSVQLVSGRTYHLLVRESDP